MLGRLAQGLDNASVARRLAMSAKSVRNHVSAIITKLEVTDRTTAVLRARDAGLGRLQDGASPGLTKNPGLPDAVP